MGRLSLTVCAPPVGTSATLTSGPFSPPTPREHAIFSKQYQKRVNANEERPLSTEIRPSDTLEVSVFEYPKIEWFSTFGKGTGIQRNKGKWNMRGILPGLSSSKYIGNSNRGLFFRQFNATTKERTLSCSSQETKIVRLINSRPSEPNVNPCEHISRTKRLFPYERIRSLKDGYVDYSCHPSLSKKQKIAQVSRSEENDSKEVLRKPESYSSKSLTNEYAYKQTSLHFSPRGGSLQIASGMASDRRLFTLIDNMVSYCCKRKAGMLNVEWMLIEQLIFVQLLGENSPSGILRECCADAILGSYFGRLVKNVWGKLEQQRTIMTYLLLVNAVLLLLHYLPKRLLRARCKKSTVTRKSLGRLVGLGTWAWIWSRSNASMDIGRSLLGYPCLQYNEMSSSFELTCSFKWNNTHEYIVLLKDEVFEGNDHVITLEGLNNWEGLFAINDSAHGGPTSLHNAPVIRNLHLAGGKTSAKGGFVIRSEQRHFIVESCSSSGTIQGDQDSNSGGGGICGQGCSGEILISHCSSSGEIQGRAGGIAGRNLGFNNDFKVNITRCHSTGNIVGRNSGGISGFRTGKSSESGVFITYCYSTGKIDGFESGGILGRGAGREEGYAYVAHSYSTGKIGGIGSGGICGASAGQVHGVVVIEQCYSTGEIHGTSSGGITGRYTSWDNGDVSIIDSYSSGNITGTQGTGGICGDESCGFSGKISLTNVYASGDIIAADAGGLIGYIDAAAREVKIRFSVYNGRTGDIIGDNAADDEDITEEKTSGDLEDIRGTVYCYSKNESEKECWDTHTTWQVVENDFPVLVNVPAMAQDPILMDPEVIKIESNRSLLDSPRLERSVLVNTALGQTIHWTPSDRAFLQVPQEGTVNESPTSTQIEQIIGIDIGQAPEGKTETQMKVQILEAGEVVMCLWLKIVVTVKQGRLGGNTNAISAAASQSDSPFFRSVRMSNNGKHSIAWWASVYDSDGNNVTSLEVLHWLSLDQLSGSIKPVEAVRTTIFEIQLAPHKVDSTGIYPAWILVETDSWDGITLLVTSPDPPYVNLTSGSRQYFWVHVDMLVTSVFLCRGSQIPSLQPMEAKVKTFTVLNTEAQEIWVLPTNLSLVVQTETNLTYTYTLHPHFVDKRIILTPWMSISPSLTTLRTGTTVTFQLKAAFFSKMLSLTNDNIDGTVITAPTRMTLHGVFGVFFGVQRSLQPVDANDAREFYAELQFKPGLAKPNMSYLQLVGNETTVIVTESIEIYVVLVDKFGQQQATATYYTEANVNSEDESGIYVQLSSADDVSTRLATRPRLFDGQTTSGFAFSVSVFSEEKVTVDVILNGTSISQSPLEIEGIPIRCRGSFEVPSTDGRECMCQPGYRRSRSIGSKDAASLGCVPCQEGYISFLPNRDFQCTICPDGFFCTVGSSLYTSCPDHGVDCTDGRLRMKEGFWCEICHDESYPTETIIKLLENSNAPFFHECFYSDACVVNSTSFKTTCHRGYEGPLCSVCESNFALEPDKTACVPCQDQTLNHFVTATAILFIFAALSIFVYRYSRNLQMENIDGGSYNCATDGAHLHRNSSYVTAVNSPREQTKGHNRNQTEDLALLIMDYLQICAILASLQFSPFQGVSSFLVEVSEISLLNPAESTQFQCTFHEDYFTRAIVSMMFPWIILVAIFLCQSVAAKTVLRTSDLRTPWLPVVLPVSLIAFNQLHASVTATTLTALQTYRHEVEGSIRAYGDLTIVGNSARHNILLAVASVTLIVYVIGFPLVATILILLKWRAGNFEELHNRFRSWTGSFIMKRPGFVWPTVVIFRKLLLLIYSRFIDDAIQQFLFVTLTLTGSYALLTCMRPYRFTSLNNAEEMKIGLALVTAILGAILHSIGSSPVVASFTNADVLVESLILLVQIVGLIAVCLTLSLILPHVLYEFQNVFVPKVKALLKRVGCCSCLGSGEDPDPTAKTSGESVIENPLSPQNRCVGVPASHSLTCNIGPPRTKSIEDSQYTVNPAFAPERKRASKDKAANQV